MDRSKEGRLEALCGVTFTRRRFRREKPSPCCVRKPIRLQMIYAFSHRSQQDDNSLPFVPQGHRADENQPSAAPGRAVLGPRPIALQLTKMPLQACEGLVDSCR